MSKPYREMNGQTQANVGPCRRCGQTVWITVGSQHHRGLITKAGPIHRRPCLDLERSA